MELSATATYKFHSKRVGGFLPQVLRTKKRVLEGCGVSREEKQFFHSEAHFRCGGRFNKNSHQRKEGKSDPRVNK